MSTTSENSAPSSTGRPEVVRNLLSDPLATALLDWVPFIQPGRKGVSVHWLYTADETGPEGAEACIARYAPGAHSNLHEHLGFELMFILEGELHNDNGDVYGPGTLIVERPGSIHRLTSPDGCTFLIVREKGMVTISLDDAI